MTVFPSNIYIMSGKMKYFYEFDIPKFIEYIKLSEKRRPVYYRLGTRIPKKYMSEDYTFDKNGILYNIETGEKVIKNSRSVGTPNMKKINSQYFWSGSNPHIRRKMKRDMSLFLLNYIKRVPPVRLKQYPIGVKIILYDVINGENDLDNFIYIWFKVLLDVLTAKEMSHRPIIIDDNRKYLRKLSVEFIPIDRHEDRKLTIQIYSI